MTATDAHHVLNTDQTVRAIEYEAARAKVALAGIAYAPILAAYRARKIGDLEFLAARKVYDTATAEFDAAYAKAAGWTD